MSNPVKEFFLFCSGASRTILGMNGCEVEHGKYAGIGATIFFTATLAALSGGYAMFTAFREEKLAIVFGLLWGLIIFNLDRFIVTSIKKQRVPANASITKWLTIKGGELLKAAPRLLLAVFISIVITRPVELKLFDPEIQGQLPALITADRTKMVQTIHAEYSNIVNEEVEIKALRDRLVSLEDEWNRRVKVASSELEGWGGTRNPGDGPEYKRRLAEARQAEQELKAFRTQFAPIIETREGRISAQKAERDRKLAEANSFIDNSGGLLKKLEALSTLTKERRSVLWASIFILLLFISLETAPILVKLFSSRGPYDDYLDAIEHAVYANQRKKISDTNDEINTLVALSRQRNADRIKTEMQMSQSTMASWTTLAPQEYHDAQVEIAKIGIALWKANELNRLKQVMNAASYGGPSTIPLTPGANLISQHAPGGSTSQNNNSGGASHTGTSTQPGPTQATTPAASQPSTNPPAVANMPPP